MAVDFRWDDEAQTVLRYVALESWNWNDLYRQMRRSLLWLDRSEQPVADRIIDFRAGGSLPAGAVAHLRSLGKATHPRTPARIILLGVDEAVQHTLGAVNGVYETHDQQIRFAQTDAEVAAILAEWRAS